SSTPFSWEHVVSRSKHIYVDGQRVATTAMIVDPTSTASEDQLPVLATVQRFFHNDPVASVGLLTDENGKRSQEIDYLPFGEILSDRHAPVEPDLPQKVAFDGKELDSETGLQYFGFRYYDPRIGRWISADPLYRTTPDIGLDNAKELNLYAFALNNPIGLHDPNGLMIPCPKGGCDPWMVLDLPGPQAIVGTSARVGVRGILAAVRWIRISAISDFKLFATMARVGYREASAAKKLFLHAVPTTTTIVANKISQKRQGTERFERYGSAEEAKASAAPVNQLLPRPGHETQPKWIGEIGTIDPVSLGAKRKYHSYRMEIEAKPGARAWLLKFAIQKSNEPGRYGIPANKLQEFNELFVKRITSKPR
ncbi:MAG: RHS repeat-associated core domain-containing protein, partial [Anaerolineales bacterium]|nr:RHS repeat-associated core domain-containing protein [Anaerolineales bacterium]